ncbi:MAG: hypothetical protein NT030_02165, partial [Candidatus Saganbacteria bacterium]|nr:hypothetical protein [Candidatus Saganbacteria bacterium]
MSGINNISMRNKKIAALFNDKNIRVRGATIHQNEKAHARAVNIVKENAFKKNIINILKPIAAPLENVDPMMHFFVYEREYVQKPITIWYQGPNSSHNLKKVTLPTKVPSLAIHYTDAKSDYRKKPNIFIQDIIMIGDKLQCRLQDKKENSQRQNFSARQNNFLAVGM